MSLQKRVSDNGRILLYRLGILHVFSHPSFLKDGLLRDRGSDANMILRSTIPGDFQSHLRLLAEKLQMRVFLSSNSIFFEVIKYFWTWTYITCIPVIICLYCCTAVGDIFDTHTTFYFVVSFYPGCEYLRSTALLKLGQRVCYLPNK